MKKWQLRLIRGIRRTVLRILVLGIVCLLWLVVYCCLIGCPDWLMTAILDKVNKGPFVCEVGSARLSPPFDIVLRDVKIYRKRVPGPPGLKAEQLSVSVSPGLPWGESFDLLQSVSRVEITKGSIDLFALAGQDSGGKLSGLPVMDLEVALTESVMEGINISRMGCRIVSDGLLMRIRNVNGVIVQGTGAGGLDGEFACDVTKQIVTGHMLTSFDPHATIPLVQAAGLSNLVEVINRFGFETTPPKCDVVFTNKMGAAGWVSVGGKFRTDDSSYQGIRNVRADGRFDVFVDPSNLVVTVAPLMVVRQEGMAEASLTYDWASQLVRFHGGSTIHPKALAQMIGIPTNGFFDVAVFDGPVKISASGCFDVEKFDRTDFTATGEARSFGIDRYITDQCSVRMQMKGLSLNLTNITGKIYGGDFSGAARFDIPLDMVTNPASTGVVSYAIKGEVADADFGKLAKVLKMPDDQGSNSRISGNVTLAGTIGTGWDRTIAGDGQVRVKDGRIFSLPIFGGLSAFMAKVIPGLDFIMRQSDARAEFSMGGGKFKSSKLTVEGDVLSLTGKGEYTLGANLDFDVQIQLMKEHTLVAKLLRAITYPISKLFEFRLKGTPKEPYWYSTNFSKDLLDKVGVQPGQAQ